jgi:hypothetical protein
MAERLMQINPHAVAVLPKRKLVQLARIGKSDPVVCVRSVWALLGLSWPRWELLLQARCLNGGFKTWPAKDGQQRRTLLITWHKMPALLELMWGDLQAFAKGAAVNDAAKLIRDWPDKRQLEAARQFITPSPETGHTQAPTCAETPPESLVSEGGSLAVVLAAKPGRVKILRTVHLPQALKLLDDGLNTVEIAKAMGISRPSVSQMINGTYVYRHD